MFLGKKALATAATKLVSPGDVIILDDSTTTLQMAEMLLQVQPLTIISNSLRIMEMFSKSASTNLICVGGVFNRVFQAFFGLTCESAISDLRADIAFLSSSAVSGLVAYHQHEEVIRAKRAMMNVSENKVLLIDSSKFTRIALNKFSELREFDRIFTNKEIDQNIIENFKKNKIPIEVV